MVLACILAAVVASGMSGLDYSAIDALIAGKEYDRARELLLEREKSAAGSEQVSVYLRLGRIVMEEAGAYYSQTREKKETLALYDRGLEWIEKGFAAPGFEKSDEAHILYFYRAFMKGVRASVTRSFTFLTQISGLLDDAAAALEIKPDYVDPVLFAAGLYSFLPGFPLSIGSKPKAVSLLRKSLDIGFGEGEDAYIERAETEWWLAQTLYDRDWSVSKRAKEKEDQLEDYSKAKERLESYLYFEGTIPPASMSDRDEARLIAGMLTDELSGVQLPSLRERTESLVKRITGETAKWKK